MFRKWDVEVRTGSSWLRIDRWQALMNAVMNFCICGEFLD
jgi:hypothetical protein